MTIYQCEPVEVSELNAQIQRIRLVPEDISLFDFKAGQYIVLHMPDGKKVPLSIASAPEQKAYLELHIRSTQRFTLAEEMIQLFKNEKVVQIEGAFGDCHLTQGGREIIIIAGGTGFSPMKSMIESAFAQNEQRSIQLYLGAQTASDLYQHQMILDWEKENDHFRYYPVISTEDKSWAGRTGFPHELALQNNQKLLADKDFFISGSEPMVMAVYQALKNHGVLCSNIYSDILNIKRDKGEID